MVNRMGEELKGTMKLLCEKELRGTNRNGVLFKEGVVYNIARIGVGKRFSIKDEYGCFRDILFDDKVRISDILFKEHFSIVEE
jgi:hypothetical protein